MILRILIFSTGTKSTIRFVYERFKCKRKKLGKKWMEKGAIRERGVGEGLMPYHMAKDSNPLQRLIRAENINRRESRKPSLEAFSQ